MLEIVICDTDEKFGDFLKERLKKFYDSKDAAVEIRVFTDGDSYVDAINDGEMTDLLFLDTKLGNVSGFAVAELVQLSEQNKHCKLIFMDENGEDVFQSFLYQPVWCIRKKNLDEDLGTALERLWELDHRKRSLFVHEGRSTCYVRMDAICMIVSDGHYVCIQCCDRSYRVRGSMSHFEELLQNQYFTQPSKKYLVNCAYIESVSDKVVMKDGSVIPCSRGKRAEVRKMLDRYMDEMEHCL